MHLFVVHTDDAGLLIDFPVDSLVDIYIYPVSKSFFSFSSNYASDLVNGIFTVKTLPSP